MFYTLSQIAASYNRPVSTTCKHIKMLKQSNRFQKKSLGAFYNDAELRQLEKLLQFKYREQK